MRSTVMQSQGTWRRGALKTFNDLMPNKKLEETWYVDNPRVRSFRPSLVRLATSHHAMATAAPTAAVSRTTPHVLIFRAIDLQLISASLASDQVTDAALIQSLLKHK